MTLQTNQTEKFTLPDLGKIQLQNFYNFLTKIIYKELKAFPKIYDSEHNFEFKIYPEEFFLVEPILNERESIYKSITYSTELYVTAELNCIKNQTKHKQKVLLGHIPLITNDGSFIINGISRAVVSQILRSPGIYFGSQLDSNSKSIYIATIISESGSRLKLEIDDRKLIWARISKKRKVSAIVLLLSMGIKLSDITRSLEYPAILDNIIKKKNVPSNQKDAILEIYKQLFSAGGDPNFSDNILSELQRTFFQQRCEIGLIGRSNLNKKLGLNIPDEEIFLLPADILATLNYLIKLSLGIGSLDDIDHLKNRRVKSISDFLSEQLKNALNKIENTIEQSIKNISKRKRIFTPKSLINSGILLAFFKDFFGSHPLSQFLDQTNSLTELVHKRRISSLGPGGLTRRTASFHVRDIHPSHYGRICPIETSEGMNAGLVASLASNATINTMGFIESPFYELNDVSLFDKPIFLSAREDENFRIALGNRLAIDQEIQEKQITPARYKQEFINTPWSLANLRSIFPWQYFSIGASLIPFLEHDDANRALMGSNMQRQAVPLLITEKPIVGTGFEANIARDSGAPLISNIDGKIQYVDSEFIEILGLDKKTYKLKLSNYQRSNNNTCIHHRAIVRLNQWVRKGQILADGSTTIKGELSLGRNILVAYMPWEGYNFEDAVLISDRLIYDDLYTSIHIQKYELEIKINHQGQDKITKDIPHIDKYFLRHLDDNGLVTLGSWVESGDVLIGKLSSQEREDSLKVPEGKLLQAIFGLQIGNSRDTSLKLPAGGEGRVIDIQWIFQDEGGIDSNNFVNVYVLQKRRIQVGDKIAGRHGNKGIVSQILSRHDMPYLQNGTSIDMVLSPLGVPSRMNVGQILECLLGFAGKFLNKNYRITPFDERYEREASRKLVLSELHKAKKLTGYPWLLEPENAGKSKLFDGRTGETFNQPVTVGSAYILKLIHQVDDKIHARSTGPYSLVTQQPVRGRSRGGGQRVGEMEVWALEGFGAAYILQEMLTVKSDHIHSRYDVLGAIVTGTTIKTPTTTPESFRLLARELRCLGIQINDIEIYRETLHKKEIEI